MADTQQAGPSSGGGGGVSDMQDATAPQDCSLLAPAPGSGPAQLCPGGQVSLRSSAGARHWVRLLGWQACPHARPAPAAVNTTPALYRVQVCTRRWAPANATQQEQGATPSTAAGLCATPKPGVLLPSSLSPAWPAPLAYFPLTAGSLDSWPGGQYTGTNQGAQFTIDTRFGSVLTCHQVGPRRRCG